ncbi:unnamed protein product [Owenia fusiformis]|uniref:Cirhin n=1 Tax=Owenia fusiformis TaxID=6347 RepID=A0A8S4NH49_OWEFU|nr:unnamed protein product [Owenia fusiformis]
MGDFKVHHIRFFDYQPKSIQCLAYNSQQDRIAIGRSDGSLEIWSIKDDWFQEKIIPGSNDNSIEAVAWCGNRVFTAGIQGSIVEYDLLTLERKVVSWSNNGAVWSLESNMAETHIAAGTEEGCIVLYELTEEGLEYFKAFDKQEGRVLSLAWAKEDKLIVTGGIDNIRIWNTTSGHAIQRLTLGRQEVTKETLVWCVGVTKDFTIISGDSRGKTSFWNGKQGTLSRSYQSHKADILCLCMNKEGNSVFLSGADSNIIQFEYITSNADSAWRQWVRSSVYVHHKHDVRALVLTSRNFLVSGGMDCKLVYSQIEANKSKSHRKIAPIPQYSLVHLAKDADFVMLQYTDNLEIWKLGSTKAETGKIGEALPLHRDPMKLIELHSKGGNHIVCSAISRDGEYVAYSDTTTIKVFKIIQEQVTVMSPKLTIQKLKIGKPDHAHRLEFSAESDCLYVASKSGRVNVLNFLEPESKETTLSRKGDCMEPIHLMTLSPNGDYLATGDHGNNVQIFSTKQRKHICSLPVYSCQPTAIAFNQTSTELVVAYTNQKIVEFNIEEQQYTKWCRMALDSFPLQWLRQHNKISHVAFNPSNPDQILIHNEQMFSILDKSQPFPKQNTYLINKDGQPIKKDKVEHAFHLCTQFRYLMFADMVGPNFMLVVEQTPTSIVDRLPPALKEKKFGT